MPVQYDRPIRPNVSIAFSAASSHGLVSGAHGVLDACHTPAGLDRMTLQSLLEHAEVDAFTRSLSIQAAPDNKSAIESTVIPDSRRQPWVRLDSR
jgi:hypothetical protein